MGMTAALKFRTIVENGESIAAIELLAAAEALRYRQPFEAGARLRGVLDRLREISAPLGEDRPLGRDIEADAGAIRDGVFDSIAGVQG
jgi:histidine ammonia-lyase